jgi:ubiquinone/menaquinone biosynthesis C-methylase UbiE
MTLARSFGEQLARPSGLGGRLLGHAMDLANRNPTRFAVDMLDPAKGERILDAGCGTGAAAREILRRSPCRVIGLDRSATMIRMAQHRFRSSEHRGAAEFHRGDLASPPFQDRSFDAVLALNILYFADPEGAMVGAIKRMLCPGGRLVAYVTDRRTMESWAFARSGTHRLFDAGELAAVLEAGGFDRDRICVVSRDIARNVSGLFATARA